MNPIEIGKAIDTYGIAMVTAIILGLVVWLVKYLIKEQSKNMKAVLGLVKVELKSLHKDGLKNARLNYKSIAMIGTLTEYLNRHFNGNIDKLNLKRKVNKTNGRK